MTDSDRAALKAIVEQWNESANFEAESNLQYAQALSQCADELAALIAAGLSEPEPPQSQLTPTTMCPDGDLHVLRCIRCELPAAGLSEAPAPQWQPIDDAPKDGTWFLCFGALWTLPALGQWSRTAHCFQSMDGALWKLTHWMPLPAPPALASPAPPKEPTHD